MCHCPTADTGTADPAELAIAAGHDARCNVGALPRWASMGTGAREEVSLPAACPARGWQDEAGAQHLQPWLGETLQGTRWAQHTRSAWGNPVKETCAPPHGKRIDRYFVRLGHSQTCPAGMAGEVMHRGERSWNYSGIWDGNILRQCHWRRLVSQSVSNSGFSLQNSITCTYLWNCSALKPNTVLSSPASDGSQRGKFYQLEKTLHLKISTLKIK